MRVNVNDAVPDRDNRLSKERISRPRRKKEGKSKAIKEGKL